MIRSHDCIVHIEATIPGSSTRKNYEISVKLNSDGRQIFNATCSCPVGCKQCKHVHAVLVRVTQSKQAPIPVVSQDMGRAAKRRRQIAKLEHASVYLVFACKSEYDSGSDYMRSARCKDRYDQECLGTFFSLKNANRFAKKHIRDAYGGLREREDDEYESDEEADDGIDEFQWDNEEDYDGDSFDKVWVERKAVEDASSNFHT